MTRLFALFLLCTSCATSWVDLDSSRRDDLCAFWANRARQGDLRACRLVAQGAAARDAEYGERVAPAVRVDLTATYDADGNVANVDDVRTSLPPAAARPVDVCFSGAVSAAPVPPPGERVRVPLRFLIDPMRHNGDAEPGSACVIRME